MTCDLNQWDQGHYENKWRVDDAALACIRHSNFRVTSRSWLCPWIMASPHSVEKGTDNGTVDPAGLLIKHPNGWFASIAVTETWLSGTIPATMLQMTIRNKFTVRQLE